MLRSKTVLVVGAGASCEANFPDGQRLLQTIQQMLDIRFEHFNRLIGGDYIISNVIRQLVPGAQYGDEYNRYLEAAWRIREAAKTGLSIDGIIEQHDDEPRVAICGKLAILRAILLAEKASALMLPRDRAEPFDIGRLAETWFGRLAQILTENIPRRRAEEVFSNLEIICFNYDRALQQFLPQALVTSWGMSLAQAQDLTAHLKVLHPYGRVAPLRWEDHNSGVEFGNADHAPYARLVEEIRTFSERIEDEQALNEIRNSMAAAKQIIFLGFAFHAPNMELLKPRESAAERVLATVYKLPENERRQIERQITGMVNLPASIDGLVLHNGTCADLFRENWRTISA